MELVLAFAGIAGGVLFLTHSLAKGGTSYRDILGGNVTLARGENFAAAAAATIPGAGAGSGANLSGSEDQRVAAANAAAGSGRLPAKVATMLTAATSVVGAPYSQANHATAFGKSAAVVKQLGTDCSGFVSYVLGKAGVITSPQTTQTLPDTQGIATGPGKYVTIYDRDQGAVDEEHTIIDIAGHWFESGGNSAENATGGISAIAAPPSSYLSSFNQLLHPVGL